MTPTAISLLALASALLVIPCKAQYYAPAENATATYYGGLDGAGTIINAACGYGDLIATGIGFANAAASIAMWNSGAICGACFEVSCRQSPWCRPGGKVIVTVTNQCPQGSQGGWCNMPNHHLDMAYPSWKQIATDPIAGVVKSYMRRVACPRTGGVRFRFNGNPWWTQLVVVNVGGSGDLASVESSIDGGQTWKAFSRSWGAVWTGGALLGKALSFRLRTGLGKEELVILNAVPSTWQLGKEYATNQNFVAAAPKPHRKVHA